MDKNVLKQGVVVSKHIAKGIAETFIYFSSDI